MAQALSDNVAGHRAKYEHLVKHMDIAEAKNLFVGGGDPVWTGFMELEIIRTARPLKGADIVDVGCGIGRLTQHLVHEPIASYLNEEILEYFQEARRILRHGGTAIFSFLDLANKTQLASFIEHTKVHRQGHGDLLTYTTQETLTILGDAAGFTNISFVDGTEELFQVSEGVTSPLISRAQIQQTFKIGQSVCFLRT